MSVEPRRARVHACAKLNLGLKVLGRRSDGFHELRTVFQTISLADTLEFEYAPSRGASVTLEAGMDVPAEENLVVRAARLVMEHAGIAGRLAVRLKKRIPMGGGLGGGSSDAAAVLLALPVLAGRRVPLDELLELAARLGSDVPFFLLGGTAAATGRGTELYPLPDPPPRRGVVVAPQVHVSTAEAYRALGRPLTSAVPSCIVNTFQASVWALSVGLPGGGASGPLENDFEAVIFGQYPQLKSIKRKLRSLGADPAMLTGSGAAVFGWFSEREDLKRALAAFPGQRVFAVASVSRRRFRRLWRRGLEPHLAAPSWPPQSRYTR